MDLSLIIPAFIAGLLTFLAPCTLPLVPGYLGFISGVSTKELEDPVQRKRVERKVFLNGVAFVIGFSLVFVAFGVLAAFLGRELAAYRVWMTRVGGGFVILFGLFMLNVIKIPWLERERRFEIPSLFQRGKALNSTILGSAFALGWTPCVGPILGSILLLASSTTTVFQGAILLLTFSAGLAVPFLILAASVGRSGDFIARHTSLLKITSIVGGVFLISLGLFLITGRFGWIISYSYKVLNFINYESLLNYL